MRGKHWIGGSDFVEVITWEDDGHSLDVLNLRHASSDVQKAADYTNLDSGEKTREAVSLGRRIHRSR